MDFEYYKNNKNKFLLDDGNYKCPICDTIKSKRGFLLHIEKTHFNIGIGCSGNNGKYSDETYKNNQKQAQSNRYNRELGELKEFEVICNKCKKTFIVQEREKQFPKKDKYFCSRSCANSRDFSYRKKIKDKKTKSRKENRIKKIKEIKYNKCLECGNKAKRTFCSSECSIIYHKKERIKKVIENNGFGDIISFAGSRWILKELKGDCCSICGIKYWNNKELVLIVDHIDGNSSNNSLDNLRLVCPNCDSQLPTYKAKNKGKGRRTLLRRLRNQQDL